MATITFTPNVAGTGGSFDLGGDLGALEVEAMDDAGTDRVRLRLTMNGDTIYTVTPAGGHVEGKDGSGTIVYPV
jgi:hypothetical protein